MYFPKQIFNELQEKIDALAPQTFSEVNPLLEECGGGQDVMEDIGFSVRYPYLDQDGATLTNAE